MKQAQPAKNLRRLADALDGKRTPTLKTAEWRELAGERFDQDILYQNHVFHHLYVGDGVLHLVSAAHRAELITVVIGLGVPVDECRNRRAATALHYAADGVVDHERYDPEAQARAVTELLRLGANPDAVDKSGATPLMRAIRCRAFAAVETLIAHGADWRIANRKGTSTLAMATMMTGRGGSGTRIAKDNQARIVVLLRRLA